MAIAIQSAGLAEASTGTGTFTLARQGLGVAHIVGVAGFSACGYGVDPDEQCGSLEVMGRPEAPDGCPSNAESGLMRQVVLWTNTAPITAGTLVPFDFFIGQAEEPCLYLVEAQQLRVAETGCPLPFTLRQYCNKEDQVFYTTLAHARLARSPECRYALRRQQITRRAVYAFIQRLRRLRSQPARSRTQHLLEGSRRELRKATLDVSQACSF